MIVLCQKKIFNFYVEDFLFYMVADYYVVSAAIIPEETSCANTGSAPSNSKV